MTKKEHSYKKKKHKKSERHYERKFKRKLGKKLLKSVNSGLSKVKKKVALCKEHDVSIDFVQKKSNASALHCASILGLTDVAEYLLDNGAMADLRDSEGNTPLHYAVKHHFPELVRALVSRGASLHSSNQKGETPTSLGARYLLHLKEKSEGEVEQEEDGNEEDRGWREDDEEEDRHWRREEEDGEFDWASHLEAEYSDNEESVHSNWREIEKEYKEMENDSWMDNIAAQARQKFSRTLPQKQKQEQEDENVRDKDRDYRRILEEEMQKDKEWRERVMQAAAMNNSEKDEEKWVEFEDKNLQEITRGDVPWPTGPSINILGIKETLPFAAKKQLVRAGLLRWHPDKFMQKFGGKLVVADKDFILERVKEISQSINHYSEKALAK